MREFFRPVATLLTGTVVAQAAIYASRPLLTRLFTPEHFGVLAFFAGFVAVVASLSGGKYEDALMLPSDPDRGASLAAASILLSLSVATVVACLTPLRGFVAAFVSSSQAADMLLVAPISIACVGIARTSDAWLTRLNRFDRVARGRVVHSAAVVPAQIAGGIGGAGSAGLVGGLVIGQAAQSLYYGRNAIAAARQGGLSWPRLESIWNAAKRYKRFALFGAPGSALNTASVQLPALMLLFFSTRPFSVTMASDTPCWRCQWRY